MKGSPQSARYGVTLLTWGTDEPGSSILPAAITAGSIVAKQTFFGTNVGHSALRITIPATPENKALVQDVLHGETPETNVSWKIKTYMTPTLEMKDGKYVANKDNPAHQEQVIEVYYSWWPQEDGFTYHSYDQDRTSEIPGVHMEYDPKWLEYLKPQERRRQGILSHFTNQMITLHPQSIAHAQHLSPSEQKALYYYQLGTKVDNELHSFDLLSQKLEKLSQAKTEIVKLGVTEVNLLKLFLPNSTLVKNQPLSINKTELQTNVKALQAAKANLDFQEALIKLHYLDACIAVRLESEPLKLDNFDQDNLNELLSLHKLIKAILQYQNHINEANDVLMPHKKALLDALNHFIQTEESSTYVTKNSNIKKLYKPDAVLGSFIYQEGAKIDPKVVKALSNEVALAIKDKIGTYFLHFMNLFNIENMSETLNPGRDADHEIMLPLKSDLNPNGLDPIAMIQAMPGLGLGKEFNLALNNCSFSCRSLLQAGAGEHQDLFNHGIFGALDLPQILSCLDTITTPQMVLDSCGELRSRLMQERQANVAEMETDVWYETETGILADENNDDNEIYFDASDKDINEPEEDPDMGTERPLKR